MTLHLLERPRDAVGIGPIPPHGNPLLGRVGNLEVRLANNKSDIIAAQKLRYRIFIEERGLEPRSCGEQIDRDHFDVFCDHLIVVDREAGGRVVGTYRLLRQDRAVLAGGYYSAAYFELNQLTIQNPGKRILELGRSCVEVAYRTKRTVELLWQGIWVYCQRHDIDVLTGCASFSGADPFQHAQSLSYLAHAYSAESNWKAHAISSRWHSMHLVDPLEIDPKSAFMSLPPLLKGYLRAGARIGDGCVIDDELQTVVVLIVLPVDLIASRYQRHFSAEPSLLPA